MKDDRASEGRLGGRWLLLLIICASLPLSWLVWRWGDSSWQQLLADVSYVPVFLCASLLCFLRSRRSTGRSRLAWTWVGLSPLAFGLGECIWAYTELVLHRQPFPSLADVFFLIQSLAMGAGLLIFPRTPLTRLGGVKRLLDVAIIMGAVLVLAWFSLGRHIVSQWQGQPLAMSVSLAYPALDVLLLTILLWNFLHRRERSDLGARRSRFLAVNAVLALSVLCAVLADVGFALNYGGAEYTLGNPSDLCWTLGACALGLAALMGSVVTAPEAQSGASRSGPAAWTTSSHLPDPETQPSGFNRHLSLYSPYVALSCCFLLVFLTVQGHESVILLIGTALVSVLVACRQLVNLLENERLNERLRLLSQGLESRVQRRTAELEATSGVLRQLTGELDARVMERTAQLEASQAQLAHQTRHDALTGLPNRSLFEERLTAALLHTTAGALTAVLYLNLDGFKAVNERFGHAQGDELLRELARRLEPLRRPGTQLGTEHSGIRGQPGEVLGRCGGDEFVLAFSQLAHPEDAESCARRVAAMIAEGFVLQGEPLSLTASIGISLAPPDGMQAAQLMRQADMAMTQAKASGKNTLCFYAPQMNRVAQERSTLERRLRLALAQVQNLSQPPAQTLAQVAAPCETLSGNPAQPEGGLRLVYQPQFLLQQPCPLEQEQSAQEHRRQEPEQQATLTEVAVPEATAPVPCSFEALLRWTDDELGSVSPAVFIPVAEDSGLIVPLGHWVLEQACAQLAQWPGCRVAVNVAAAQFEREDFVPEVRELLSRHQLDGSCLELELTERQVVSDLEGTSRKMHELRELGVQVALDDFGVGQSALGHLLRLPVGVLKVDRMFVQGLNEVVGAPRVLQAIVALAHALDIRVVAEGVETPAQLSMVRDLGCDLVQGYLTGRPLGVQEATRLLALPASLLTDPAPAL